MYTPTGPVMITQEPLDDIGFIIFPCYLDSKPCQTSKPRVQVCNGEILLM